MSGGNKSEIRTIGVQFALFAWEHQPDVRSHARGQDIDSGAVRARGPWRESNKIIRRDHLMFAFDGGLYFKGPQRTVGVLLFRKERR